MKIYLTLALVLLVAYVLGSVIIYSDTMLRYQEKQITIDMLHTKGFI